MRVVILPIHGINDHIREDESSYPYLSDMINMCHFAADASSHDNKKVTFDLISLSRFVHIAFQYFFIQHAILFNIRGVNFNSLFS